MKDIQSACADLAGYADSFVTNVAARISKADHQREADYDNEIVLKDAKISTLSAEIRVIKADNRRLRAQINKLADMQFGQSSEKSPKRKDKGNVEADHGKAPPDPMKPGQDGSSIVSEPEKVSKPWGMKGKQTVIIPAHLPREDRVIEPKQGAGCTCGCAMRPMGEQVIERLTYKPAEVRVIREHYPKYVCRICDKFVQAKVPPRAFDYTRFDDRLIAGLAVSKFADFIPNYRQEQIFKRSGIKFHRSTMVRLMDELGNALVPVHAALTANLKTSTKLNMDETVLSQLLPGNGKTKTCYVWALCRDDRRWLGNEPPGVVFNFEQSRRGEHAEEILRGFSGTLQVDGYAGYNRLTRDERDGGPLVLAYCWAHVRRKFLDVFKATKSKKANSVIELINEIYEVERSLKGKTAAIRLAVRKKEAQPIVFRLFTLLRKLSGEISMKSTLGGAIAYTMKLRDGLTVFLEDGRVEFDNNAVENTIRPIALLRKNALFAGSEIGGRNWALMASLIGTCKLNGVEPYAYLTWLFDRMAAGHPRSEYEKLLPWHCPKGRFGIE
ncbi:IS66 family transposase [Ruegeria sp. R13_0]|uniref:IS66 family transposase n=1 Tax=Ruegeria sp. R13_0 TaxID=2821099 RepID=UPI001ADBC821|nr:IS66 family transposase [Ruegeria sp. R13_0]MBO9436997.1 IS66 family transposase [Ruegeria sp. R13_0]